MTAPHLQRRKTLLWLLLACQDTVAFHPALISQRMVSSKGKQTSYQHSDKTTPNRILRLSMSSDEDYYNNDSSNKSNNKSPNEFSRTIRTDRVLRRNRNVQDQRDYKLSIEASPDECQALSNRFELTDLTQLDAALQIRPAISAGAVDGSNVVLPVEVEGTISAHLTQTCVRTNERFEVDVEFPVYALVKPMSVEALMKTSMDYDDTKKSKKKSSKKSTKAKLAQSTKQVYSLDDVVDLQAAIEANSIFDDDNDNNPFDDTSTALVEDKAIYSSQTGVLDLGELVAQTFWLQLDPFPKKPGTGPIEMEISG